MEKLKILVIPSWYPNEKDPLWGNYFIKQSEALSELCDVSMLHIYRAGLRELHKFNKERKTDGYDDAKYSFKFYKKTILNFKSLSVDFSYKRYAKAAYKAYKRLEKIIGRVDVILVESALPGGLAAKYISDKEGIPYVVHAHSEAILTNPAYEKYTDIIVKDADDYMAVNSNIRSLVENKRGKKCHLVPNFIDCAKFRVKSGKRDVDNFTLVSVSNFYKVKAIDVLLHAFNIVVNQKGMKNLKLKIVGTGEYKDFYESICKSLNLTNNVEFTGYIDNDELPNLLSKCNVLCVSSTFETFCIPIVEALASGMPVITTDCAGPLEIVNDSNSIVTPINDVNAYADSIIKMINNYSKYDSKAISEYAFNRYDKSVICNEIINICKNANKENL